MIIDSDTLNQIAFSLADHYDCVYYVEIETGRFIVFTDNYHEDPTEFPDKGEDFFANAVANAEIYIHPDDIELMKKTYDMDLMIARLEKEGHYSVTFRAVVDGKVYHKRHIVVLCKDKKHVICCLEDVETEFREKEEQKKNLQSAKLMARRDELTGVKNSNAFQEYMEQMEQKIKAKEEDIRFAIVMCDINDLKVINDTRGHNYGDEAIRATSRQICATFQHSPVFRTGGDEFVVVLNGKDYDKREQLMAAFREEVEVNRKLRSGPVVASGIAVFGKDDKCFTDVFKRADHQMYENKKQIKSIRNIEEIRSMEKNDIPIPAERKRHLEAMFGAFVTIAGGGYIYLNDIRYNYSRWALSLIDDFGLESVYMYHAEKTWEKYIHPDDLEIYKKAADTLVSGDHELKPIKYRARKADGTYVVLSTRGFVLSDADGNPEYFGGIMVPE